MSALPAPTWSASTELTAPSQSERRRLVDVTEEFLGVLKEHLTPAGRSRLAEQLGEALEDPDPQAVIYVIEAWYRSWLIRQDPDFSLIAERRADARTYTSEELRTALGI